MKMRRSLVAKCLSASKEAICVLKRYVSEYLKLSSTCYTGHERGSAERAKVPG